MTHNLLVLRRRSLIQDLWIAGVASLLTILIGMPRAASAEGEHRVLIGLATTTARITTWWHPAGSTTQSNLDIRKTFSDDPTQFTSVYWQSYHMGGQAFLAWLGTYTGACTGTEVILYKLWIDEGGRQVYSSIGRIWYVHIGQGIPAGYNWWVPANNGYTTQYIGSVLDDEVNACKNATPQPLWTGPHLHQGGDISPGTAVFTNWSLPSFATAGVPTECDLAGSNCILYPTGDNVNRWMHKIVW